ncbi:MAG: glycosyltransferase family 39 protein, partial [Candidatus Omnitrophica bacterium]|nr:glycosyltransferase family 39 protein [Candidatus Omnitrophota bacterium]
MRFVLSNKTLSTFFIMILLGLLTASAFFLRLDNFKNSPARSIDEVVYYRMAKQIRADINSYNTIPYAEELMAEGRPLPDYFTQPLFKHPPLFVFLIAVSMQFFGETMLTAGYVSLLLSALTIPLVYLLGTSVYDRKAGLMASLLLWMDPVSIICSQKIWLGTTITFFSVLAVLFFSQAVKKENNILFLLSGVAVGLAAATKYTGCLLTFAFTLYAISYRPRLWRNGSFILSLFLPFVVLMPWFIWNYKVYGPTLIQNQATLHYEVVRLFEGFSLLKAGLLITLVLCLGAGLKYFNGNRIQDKQTSSIPVAGWLLFTGLLVILWESIVRSLTFGPLPSHSWGSGLFRHEPPVFYFGRLIEFSFVYVFAFAGLFHLYPDDNSQKNILTLSAIIILAFFILWRNYQSRYILTSIPF